MKIAVMGAGLAGLSCAAVLEKHGLNVTIFEKRAQVGDRFVNGEIFLSVLARPVTDEIAYLSDKHGIFLQPAGNIKRLALYSEHEQAEITGDLGFTTIRGREEDSLEKQLARQVRSKIVCSSQFSYEEIQQEYSHVVLATGDGADAMRLQNYRADLTVTLRGATVTGNFQRHAVAAWLDNNLAPHGYGYLIPFSDKEANIVIAFPDNDRATAGEFWSRFCRRVRLALKQELPVTDQFCVTGYVIGICERARIGNTFFTVNCFGSVMPFLGFGQFAAILSGVYAALDLCGQGSYEELARPLRQSYSYSLTLRRALEKLDNRGFDLAVRALGGPLGRRLFSSRRNFLKAAAYLLRPLL